MTSCVHGLLPGTEATKDLIVSSNLPALLLHHMRSSSDAEVRAVCCLLCACLAVRMHAPV